MKVKVCCIWMRSKVFAGEENIGLDLKSSEGTSGEENAEDISPCVHCSTNNFLRWW